MSFSGTTDKCKACDKTVHIIDLLSADGISYHKSCFKCSQCNGVLVMGNYCSMEGVLYCKIHFEQTFKETGTYKNKNGTEGEKPNPLHAKPPSRLAGFFSGTQDKCGVCKKTAYPLEKLTVEGEIYHKSCFRCAHGGCVLTTSTYAALEGFLYCKHHFSQLFKEKGSYNHLTEMSNSKRSSAAASPAESDSETKPKEDDTKPEPEAEAKEDDTKPEPEAEAEAEAEVEAEE